MPFPKGCRLGDTSRWFYMPTCDYGRMAYDYRRRTDPVRVLAWMLLAAVVLVVLTLLVCFAPAVIGAISVIVQDSQ